MDQGARNVLRGHRAAVCRGTGQLLAKRARHVSDSQPSENIAYADLAGSVIETVAHIRENKRIVIMFCAFQGPPRILRIHGQARFHDSKSDEFATLKNRFEALPGIRGIIDISVNRIAESCGYGV